MVEACGTCRLRRGGEEHGSSGGTLARSREPGSSQLQDRPFPESKQETRQAPSCNDGQTHRPGGKAWVRLCVPEGSGPPLTCKNRCQTLDAGTEAETRWAHQRRDCRHGSSPRGHHPGGTLGVFRVWETHREYVVVTGGSHPPSATSLCRPPLHGLITHHSGHRAPPHICECWPTPAPVPSPRACPRSRRALLLPERERGRLVQGSLHTSERSSRLQQRPR